MATKYRTQKARGLSALADEGLNTPSFHVYQSPDEVRDMPFPSTFARPCPTTPRHGFLDSRRVDTVDELRALVAHTLEIDPNGEVIVMPYVQSRKSAVMTATQVTVGSGHDGATGGKAGAVTMPLVRVDVPRAAGVSFGYVESVLAISNAVEFTQLRDGPPAPHAGATWIPRDVRVARILVPGPDALAWEAACKAAQRGDFAHIPGGTMLCHAAVHCVLNGIPLSFAPVPPAIGDRLRANADDAPHLYHDDVAAGVMHGVIADVGQQRAMRAGVFATHQGLALPKSRDGARVAGAGMIALLRSAASFCLGELRHTKTGAKLIREKFLPDGLTGGRSQIYRAGWARYLDARPLLPATEANFRNGKNWPSSSYGGKKWAECTALSCALDLSLQRLTGNPNAATYAAALSAAHNLVNAVHNGGGLFTKLVSGVVLDNLAAGDLASTQDAAYCASDLLDALTSNHATLPPMTFDAPTKPKKPGYGAGGKTYARVPKGTRLQFRVLTNKKTGEEEGTRWQIIGAGKVKAVNEHDFSVPGALVQAANLAGMQPQLAPSGAGTGAQYVVVPRKFWKRLPASVSAWLIAAYELKDPRSDRGPVSGDDDDDDDDKCGDPSCGSCYPHDDDDDECDGDGDGDDCC